MGCCPGEWCCLPQVWLKPEVEACAMFQLEHLPHASKHFQDDPLEGPSMCRCVEPCPCETFRKLTASPHHVPAPCYRCPPPLSLPLKNSEWAVFKNLTKVFFFNWHVFDLQRCVSCRYTTKGCSLHIHISVLFQGLQWLSGKESTCNSGTIGDMGLIPELGRPPGGGHGNPLQYSCHGQRSLAGYGPWGHKELDITEVT